MPPLAHAGFHLVGVYLLGIAASSGIAAAATPTLLADYPQMEVVWLGSFSGKVAVNPLTDLVTTRAGEIEWKVADGASLTEATSLAICGASQINQSAKALALEEANLPLKLRDAEKSHREKRATEETQLEDLKNQLQKLDLSSEENELLGPELAKRVTSGKQKLRREIENLKEYLNPALAADELRLAKEKINLDVEKLRLEQFESIRSFEIAAPHAGILRISRTGYIRASEIVGTLENKGVATITLQIVDPEILNENPELLEASVTDPRGKDYIAKFSHIEKNSTIRVGFLIYHFKLEARPDFELPSDLTGERLVVLSRKLERKAYILPKIDFLFENTAEVQQLGWPAFVEKRFPGSKIFFVGPRSLAITRGE